MSISQNQLIDCAQQALKEGAFLTARRLIELASGLDSSATKAHTAVKTALDIQKPEATHQELHTWKQVFPSLYPLCCDYVRTLQVGETFSFCSMADYVETRPGITLDRAFVDYSERWRRQISYAIEKLRARGYIEKAEKNTHYRVIKHP